MSGSKDSSGRKVSTMGVLARNLGFEHPSLYPEGKQPRARSGSAAATPTESQDTVDWQQPQPGLKRRSRTASSGDASAAADGDAPRGHTRNHVFCRVYTRLGVLCGWGSASRLLTCGFRLLSPAAKKTPALSPTRDRRHTRLPSRS